MEPVNTGSAGALARSPGAGAIPDNPFSQTNRSRFALMAGEGARAPSVETPVQIDHLRARAGATRSRESC